MKTRPIPACRQLAAPGLGHQNAICPLNPDKQEGPKVMNEQRRTDELRTGDVVRYDETIRTVTHTQPANSDRVLIVFNDAGTVLATADTVWTLPAEGEIDAARAAAHREDMARALEHMAALIRRHQVAPTRYSVDVSVAVDTICELQTWATALDRQIEPGGTDGTIPAIRARGFASFGEMRLDVHAQAMEKFPVAETTDETAADYAEPPDPVVIDVDDCAREVAAALQDCQS